MNKNAYSWALAVALLINTGCGRATSQSDAAVAAPASSTSAAVSGKPVPAAVVSNGGVCAGAMEALASCASAKACDEEISMYLPATSRSLLIALEGVPGYSEEAFDRYCINDCKTRDSRVESAAFQQNVCGVQATALAKGRPDGGPALGTKLVARAFSLRGKLETGTAGCRWPRWWRRLGSLEANHPRPMSAAARSMKETSRNMPTRISQ